MDCKYCSQKVDFSWAVLANEVLGVPRALDHFKRLKDQPWTSKTFLKEMAIGLVEMIPILGGLVSLIEGVAIPYFFPKNYCGNSKFLWKNMVKAAEEHRAASKEKEPPYPTEEMLEHFRMEASIEPIEQLVIGEISTHSVTKLGSRHESDNEDRTLIIQNEQGLLAAVFDGHGGKEVVDYVKQAIEERFLSLLKRKKGDVVATYEQLTHDVDEEIRKKFETRERTRIRSGNKREDGENLEENEWACGSTAVMCWIDAKNNQMTTMTLGDSEANIYRKYEEKMVSIPCSPIRNWASPKDRERAIRALNDPSLIDKWCAQRPKDVRFPGQDIFPSTNVSRAFGDHDLKKWNGKPGLIHKPKYTEFSLNAGDVIVLASDGLRGECSESDIIEQVQRGSAQTLAESIAKIRLTKHFRRFLNDDTTVITVSVR